MNEYIVVNARLKILSADEGGRRKSGIKSGYRPNHVFELIDGKFKSTFIGQITFDDQEWIYPGDERVVNVTFLKFDGIENFILVGREWWIYEGSNLIGKAEILSVR